MTWIYWMLFDGGQPHLSSWEDQIISLKYFLNFPNLAVAPIGGQFDSGKRIPNKWDPFLDQLQLFILMMLQWLVGWTVFDVIKGH